MYIHTGTYVATLLAMYVHKLVSKIILTFLNGISIIM